MVAADQVRMLELRSQPEAPPTEWLVAVTQRKKIAVITITIITLTPQPSLSASILVQISTYTEDQQGQCYKRRDWTKENSKIHKNKINHEESSWLRKNRVEQWGDKSKPYHELLLKSVQCCLQVSITGRCVLQIGRNRVEEEGAATNWTRSGE